MALKPWERCWATAQPTAIRRLGRGPTTIASNHRQADVDVTAGSIGIRADLVGFLNQILRLLLLHPRQRDAQRNFQTETTFRTRPDAYIRGD